MDARKQPFNNMALGLGMTGAGLWILSMLGPAFALPHNFSLSVLAYDKQVVCFLLLFLATMYALSLHSAVAQLFLGILFFFFFLWLKSDFNLTANGTIAMIAGSVLIATAAVLRHSIRVTQERVNRHRVRIPIVVFIVGSVASAISVLLPSSIVGKAYQVPGAFVAMIVSLTLTLIGSLLVLINLNNNELRTLRFRSTLSPGDGAPGSPTIAKLGFGLILAGIGGLFVFALLRTIFPVLAVQSLPSGSRLFPTYSTSNLLDSASQPYYAGAMVTLLGLSIFLFATRKIYSALTAASTMLALTILRLQFLPTEAEQIRNHGLVSDYSIMWESWLALMISNWLMILSCFLSIQHFRREGHLKLDELGL